MTEQLYYIYKCDSFSSRRKIVKRNLTFQDATDTLKEYHNTAYNIFTIVKMPTKNEIPKL